MSPVTPPAIFLGSALLFCLQPMVGRTLLPAFGGSAAVWSVCLAAFQVLLVGGYGYAHALAGLDARRQRRLHLALLGVAVAWAFAVALFGLAWARQNLHAGAFPAMEVLLVVLAGAGVPYLILSAGSSLLQAWAGANAGGHGGAGGRGVYRLYAVSNLGSFAGLFAYPVLMEPHVSLTWQWLGWSLGLAVYLALVAFVAWQPGNTTPGPVRQDAVAPGVAPGKAGHVTLPRLLSAPAWWLALPGLSSFTLVATTNHLSMDVTPMPLLWAILLGAFLLSYVAGFSRIGERLIPMWRTLAIGSLIACGYVARDAGGGDSFLPTIAAGVAMVFLCGTFLHGWLYAIRPEGARLTRFYFCVAVGGAIGGMAVSFGAPLVFNGFWEYHGALVACAAVSIVFAALSRERFWVARIFNVAAVLASASVCVLVWKALAIEGQGIILRERNFYGVVKVTGFDAMVLGEDATVYMITHGGTMHGHQAHSKYSGNEELATMHTSYYSPLAGGLALMLNDKWAGAPRSTVKLRDAGRLARAKGQPMRVAVIGLGIGSMLTWAREGDEWRYFEINPLVDKVSRMEDFFTQVKNSPAATQTVIGDARLMLGREQAAGEPAYDVLVMDAYSGDSVPLHLATAEAFELYAKRLAPGGILAMHISNWHLDLLPLCKAGARILGMHVAGVQSPEDNDRLIETALWVFLSREEIALDAAGTDADLVDFSLVRDMRMPTDEWGSLWELLHFDYEVPLLDKTGRESGDVPFVP